VLCRKAMSRSNVARSWPRRSSSRRCRSIDVQADDGLELGGEIGIGRALEGPDAVQLEIMRGPDPLHRAQGDGGVSGHRPAGPVRGFAGRLGTGQRDHPAHRPVAQRRLARLAAGVPELPVDTPASAKRRCQRHTAGRPTPARRATWATLSRSAEPRMIRARATCFWARWRSATIASKPARSSAETTGHTI
jgi:hypothetical protein